MDEVEDAELAVRRAREVLALYSDLHDAELTNIALDVEACTASMVFRAERYPTEDVDQVALTMQRVRHFKIKTPGPVKHGFEDFAFPVSGLIEAVNIDETEGHMTVTIRGTYGWRIECAADALRAMVLV